MANVQKIPNNPQPPTLTQVYVSLPEFLDLLQKAQKAGIDNPILQSYSSYLPPQPKEENNWLWTGVKVAAGMSVLAAIGYNLDWFGMQDKVGLFGKQLQELSANYLPTEVHSALKEGTEAVVEAGGNIAQWVDETLNVTAPAKEVLEIVSGTVDTTVKVAKVGGALWLGSKLGGPIGFLGKLYAYSPLPGASALRRAYRR